MFDKGDRVNTPNGPGSVIYKRMAGPDYTRVAMYSVCLDYRKAESEQPPFPNYSGSAFPAEEITERIK